MCGLKFRYDSLNWITLNWTMQRQTKANIAKSSCETCVMEYYAVWRGNSLLTFQDMLSAPSSKFKKSKRENRAQVNLTDKLFFFFLGGGGFFFFKSDPLKKLEATHSRFDPRNSVP
jgi:hypothetical protein